MKLAGVQRRNGLFVIGLFNCNIVYISCTLTTKVARSQSGKKNIKKKNKKKKKRDYKIYLTKLAS